MLLRSRSRSSVATNGEEPPRKKRKNKKASASQVLPNTTISSLPDDLVLSCLARVSRSYYPTLSLVSKKFRSLIASPEIYKVRSLSGLTESCLYICFLVDPDFDSHWFTLYKKPDTKTKTKKKKQKQPRSNLLVPIPSPDSLQAPWSDVASIGSTIYAIGGCIDNAPSSKVSFLDCKSHTWHQGPNMQEARKFRGANVIDGKIYVTGGRGIRDDYNPCNWIEFFDPKTQIWNSVSSSGQEICGGERILSRGIDGKIFIYGGGKSVAYNPKDGKFETIESDMCIALLYHSHCVVDNVLFYQDDEYFKWFDSKVRLWRDLKGLESLKLKIHGSRSVRLTDYGGKIAVLWDMYDKAKDSEEKTIWFGVISVERRRNDKEEEDEIWGKVEFVDCVVTVPKSYRLWKAISATL